MVIQITDEMRNNIVYEGTTRKFGITLDGINYMVKFAKDNDLSVFCEYIASSFITELGFPCQKVSLGYYNGEYVDVVYDRSRYITIHVHSSQNGF